MGKHIHQMNSNPVELLAQNEYNELSQLTNKQVGNGLQSIDYEYNIRGWLSKINEPTDLNGKLFGYEIKYTNPEEATARFNGNIAEIDWAKATGINEPTIRRYSYTYDAVNRLTNANFSEPNTAFPNNEFYNESMSYDLNGNITQLSRNAPSFYGNYAEQIDELSYDYNGNRLIAVSDGSGNPTGYEGGGGSISYDANGNMIDMYDRGIEQIDYNHLNLPTKLRIEGFNKSVTYRYRADGTKLKKSFVFMEDNGALYSSSTEYLDGFHYVSSTGDELWWAFYEESGSAYEPEAFVNMVSDSNYDNVLKFFPTSEGFYDFENNEYIYQYKDHLGNVRLSFKREGNQNPIVTDSNDFYPFGMSFVRNSEEDAHFGTGSYFNYKYNGKELQETGMYDYGARFYMPDIGRWISVDPLSEEFSSWSPYHYGYNNPIRFIDPDGRSNQDFVQRKDGSIYWDNKANNQATTKSGETYLGKELTFKFNSYIDAKSWDGPNSKAPGDKLTSTVTLTARENDAGELTSLVGKATHKVGSTPIGTARDYYPGEGGSNNVFDLTTTSKGINVNFEQHASVSWQEEFGMKAMGFKIVDVAQKLDINYNSKNGNLSVVAFTNIFPSANLTVSGSGNTSTLMQYNQPSFPATHKAPVTGIISTVRGGTAPRVDTSYYPSRFYKRN